MLLSTMLCIAVIIFFVWPNAVVFLPDGFSLPPYRVFVVLVEFLEGHVCDEGLFRKAGSVSRQRAIRVSVVLFCIFTCDDPYLAVSYQNLLDCPTPSLPADCNPHDVASILKQLLRQLPHPLLPAHFWPLLEACVTTMPTKEQTRCILLSCLLLPTMHLQVSHGRWWLVLGQRIQCSLLVRNLNVHAQDC